jgi:hypothetical protein
MDAKKGVMETVTKKMIVMAVVAVKRIGINNKATLIEY